MKLRTKMRRIGTNVGFTLLFLFFSLCFTTSLLALPVNATAPDFTLATLDGKKVSLGDYKGKTVILKLGTTWCPGCRDQDKELQKIDAFISEQNITLIQVFLDDPVKEIQSYQRNFPMKSPVVTLLGDDKMMRNYGVYAIPRLIILSPEQKVLSDTTGITGQKIKARILQK
ncbi:MAG: TlpA family protein disulfide reductase [Desulfuromonadales bacterium]|nr:TlpA family protein disulfide reductase [Desulfuromonadales bacterium]